MASEEVQRNPSPPQREMAQRQPVGEWELVCIGRRMPATHSREVQSPVMGYKQGPGQCRNGATPASPRAENLS